MDASASWKVSHRSIGSAQQSMQIGCLPPVELNDRTPIRAVGDKETESGEPSGELKIRGNVSLSTGKIAKAN